MTCKPWRRLFTDRAFLRRLLPDQGQGHRSRLLEINAASRVCRAAQACLCRVRRVHGARCCAASCGVRVA
ncbi:hypothetical protein C2845_PM07G33720 [Panicum miliaceum]|uniref:F-box domain-containing protein n=1 Tax=Panicum miliaceum TaxID=4540 RepID=A0A3L6SLM7_PANMI|nr:hypothetical protein C2845_PM07G33720 [Panicum miliaceum]